MYPDPTGKQPITVAIVGLGLIGGSVARDLAQCGLATTQIGVEDDSDHRRAALRLGLVDRIMTLAEAVAAADWIILAVPVDIIVGLLPRVLDLVTDRQVVVDMGSTKQAVVAAVKNHPNRRRFVAAHPMAGTEKSGPSAALEGLFSGRIAILCDTEQSAPDAVAAAEQLFTAGLDMHLVTMGAAQHDLHAAYVSHLSHVISYALALTTLDKERDEEALFSLAGGGFGSTVRLAKSDAAMWEPIFRQNRVHLLQAISAYRQHLDALTEAIADDDPGQIRSLIREANRIRTILP